MKSIKFILLFTLFLSGVMFTSAQTPNPNYDASLAASLNADSLGMKMYVLVILKTGSNHVVDKAKRDSLFAGHFANINRLVGLKKLVVAGPLKKNEQTYRGIFILDVSTFEEAKVCLDADPAIKEKVFDVELFQWYGSAALPQYLPAADKIWKDKP